MDEGQPRVRRRGMFINVETPDLDAAEQDSAEGISVRRVQPRKPSQQVRPASLSTTKNAAAAQPRSVSGRSVRSAIGTGSHQPLQMSR